MSDSDKTNSSPMANENPEPSNENPRERIFSVFEQQASHRMSMETNFGSGEQSLNKRGQHYALITAIIFMCAGVFLVMNDHDTAGIALMSIDIVALAVAFITGKVMGAKDKEE